MKILNEIEGTDLVRVEDNHEIKIIYKKDLEGEEKNE